MIRALEQRRRVRQIDQQVDRLLSSGAQRLLASRVAAFAGVPVDTVRVRLTALARRGKLRLVIEHQCAHCQCTIATYGLRQPIPVGDLVQCWSCGTHQQPAEEHFQVFFERVAQYHG